MDYGSCLCGTRSRGLQRGTEHGYRMDLCHLAVYGISVRVRSCVRGRDRNFDHGASRAYHATRPSTRT